MLAARMSRSAAWWVRECNLRTIKGNRDATRDYWLAFLLVALVAGCIGKL